MNRIEKWKCVVVATDAVRNVKDRINFYCVEEMELENDWKS